MASRHVYLAGPMRGIENLNYPEFDKWARQIRLLWRDWDVFNPIEVAGGEQDLPLRDYFRADFKYLLDQADTIAFLPGWQGSEGSLIEYGIARALELDFILLDESPMTVRDASEWPERAPVAYEAHRLVYGDRGASYGHPRDNFRDIGNLWSSLLWREEVLADDRCTITPENVADMMTLVKISRGSDNYKRDNVIDAIGYQIAKQRVVDGK